MDQAAHLTLREISLWDIFLRARQRKIDVETLVGLLRELYEGLISVEGAEHEFWKSVLCGKTA